MCMLPQRIFWVFLWGLSVGWGCQKQERHVSLTVRVSSHEGSPLPGALVHWDDMVVGETDARGILKAYREKKINTGTRIFIKKESQTHFFSDFNKSLLVDDRPPRDESLPLSVEAVLYDVPKMLPKKVSLDSEAAPQKHPGALSNPSTDKEPLQSPPSEGPPSQIILRHQPEPQAPEDDAAPDPENAVPPQIQSPNHIFTVHLVQKEKSTNKQLSTSPDTPLAEGLVRLFKRDVPTPLATCTTNERGRCVLKLGHLWDETLMVLATKKDFLSASAKIVLKPQGLLKLPMKPGNSFDLFTYEQSYQRQRAVQGMRVVIQKRSVGETNEFGFISKPWTLASDERVLVTLRDPSGQYIRSEREFTAPPVSTMVKIFPPELEIRPRLALLPPSMVLPLSSQGLPTHHQMTKTLQKTLEEQLFRTKIFQEYPSSLVTKRMNERHQGTRQIVTEGFDSLDLGPMLDGLIFSEIRPSRITPDDKPYTGPWEVELRVLDHRGKTLCGTLMDLAPVDTTGQPESMAKTLTALESTVHSAAVALVADFPFQGKINTFDTQKSPPEIVGTLHPGLKGIVGKTMPSRMIILGSQRSPDGNEDTWTQIAKVKDVKLDGTTVVGHVDWQAQRSLVEQGSVFQLPSRHTPELATKSQEVYALRVYGDGDRHQHIPLGQAHLYAGGHWLAESSPQGAIIVSASHGARSDSYRITRAGYETISLKPKIHKMPEEDDQREEQPTFQRIQMKLQSLLLSVDSQPQNAQVLINGKSLGRTPLETAINRDELGTDIELQLTLGSGYKKIRRSLGLPDQPILLRGHEKLIFEEDILAKSERLAQSGKHLEALKMVELMSEDHSDYVRGQKLAAKFALEPLEDPEKALFFYNRALHRLSQSATSSENIELESEIIRLKIQRMMILFEQDQKRNVNWSMEELSSQREMLVRILTELEETKGLTKEEKDRLTQKGRFLEAWTYHLSSRRRKDTVSTFQAQKKWREFLKGLTETLQTPISNQDTELLELKNKAETLVTTLPGGTSQAARRGNMTENL